MTLQNIKKMKNEKGFTIVELLIVIVIIGILAAITIVAYNGITQRANTASAKSAASNTIAKMEAYNADSTSGGYPAYSSLLTGAPSTATYQLSGVTASTGTGTNNTTAPTAKPSDPSVVNFYSCNTGARVDYYQYDGTAGWVAMYTGGASSSTTCTFKTAAASS